jgi:hypothetical protein
MKFSELEFKPHPSGMGGVQTKGKFKNGWGYSIIRSEYSYGGREGKWELTVLGKDGHRHCDNPVARGDVRGHLTEVKVEELLNEIENFGEEVEYDSNE